jgi:hypothetical protein
MDAYKIDLRQLVCPDRLWRLGLSNREEDRAAFLQAIEAGPVKKEAERVFAVGQIELVEVRRVGGSATYELVDGKDLCFAMLYLWLKGLVKTDAPLVNATIS